MNECQEQISQIQILILNVSVKLKICSLKSNNYKSSLEYFTKMYTSRPSKQQEKKGLELIKNLILSQKIVKTTPSDDYIKFVSETSIKQHLTHSHNIPSGKVSENGLSAKNITHKLRSNNPQNQRVRNHHFVVNPDYSKKLKPNTEKTILNQHCSLQNIQSNMRIEQNEQNEQIEQNEKILSIIKFDKSLQKHCLFENNLKDSFINLTSTMRNKQSVLNRDQLSPKKSLFNSLRQVQFVQKPKAVSESKFARQRLLYQEVKRLQRVLVQENEGIKKRRKQFFELLQCVKRKHLSVEQQFMECDRKIGQFQREMDRWEGQSRGREQKKEKLLRQIKGIQSLLQEQDSQFTQVRQRLRQQKERRQQANSEITRRIYQKKQQLITKQQESQLFHSKQQVTKSTIRRLILKQQQVNRLQLQKQLKTIQRKQNLKNNLQLLIQRQEKGLIFERLDKQLNLIKEYFKISDNSKEFRNNIKRMTKFDSYLKLIQSFHNSQQYNQDLMLLYKRSLWNTDMPKFLNQQPLFIESPVVRELKNSYKQLQIQRQALNQVLKEKDRLVERLTFKSVKLSEQVEEMKQQMEKQKQIEEVSSQIKWGF